MYNELTEYPYISGVFRKRDMILWIVQPFQNLFTKLSRFKLQGRTILGHSDHDFNLYIRF